jgi:hypothetical protein
VCTAAITGIIMNLDGFPDGTKNISGNSSYDIFCLVSLFVLLIIPMAILFSTGLRMSLNKKFITTKSAKTLMLSWIVALSVSIFNIFYVVSQFKSEGTAQQIHRFSIQPNKSLYLCLNDRKITYGNFSVEIAPINDTVLQINQNLNAQGPNTAMADKLARLVVQKLSFSDTVLTIDNEVSHGIIHSFRVPRVHNKIHIPYNQPFIMNDVLVNHLSGDLLIDTLYNFELINKTLIYSNDGLVCLNCGPSVLKQDKEKEEADKLSQSLDNPDEDGITVIGDTVINGRHYKYRFKAKEKEEEE